MFPHIYVVQTVLFHLCNSIVCVIVAVLFLEMTTWIVRLSIVGMLCPFVLSSK